MSPILYSVLGFIVAIGLLTTIHEFGHFWVARRLGVKVLRFSIGFGKALLSWHDKQGTEYVIAVIPLGGYVKMLDQNQGVVAPNEMQRAFNNKPVWARMLIIIAGPAFNIIFAILAYWILFMWGTSIAQSYNPATALLMSFERTVEYSVLILQLLGNMLTGEISLQNIAGPISIAKFAGITVTAGMEYFLSFLALVSINLGVLNMLPIPMLDGGHFMFCIVELLRGKALSRQTIGYAQIFGAVVLGGLMLMAVFNDLYRVMQ